MVGGDAVGSGTVPQAGRSRVRFQMVTLEFFINIILPVALTKWLRHCVTNWKVAGSIPYGVIGIFH
jgi:hypothetical protein